mgnify:CR=1 FL=1
MLERTKFTSPGVLLIAAIVLAGAIFLLDLFYLQPYVEAQTNHAFDEQVFRAGEALDKALRKVLEKFFPELRTARLTDYKVRILDADAGTAARTRVLITSSDGQTTWSTVGCGTNVIEASWLALADALEYALVAAPIRHAESVEA